MASGDPLSDRVILWTRVIPENPNVTLNVRWQVALDRSFARVVSAGEATSEAKQDYIVKIDATGLSPSTTYFYRFSTLGVTSETGQSQNLAYWPSGILSNGRGVLLELPSRLLQRLPSHE